MQEKHARATLKTMREGGDGAEREALANAMQALIDVKRHLSESPNRGAEAEKKT